MTGITPRVRLAETVAAGEIVPIRALLTHPMETGRRTGPDGAPVPRWIVTRFTAAFEGETILSVEVDAAIAANPYFAFDARVEAAGVFTFTWIDDHGAVYSERRSVTLV